MILPVMQAVLGGEDKYLNWITGVLPDVSPDRLLLVVGSIFVTFIVLKNIAIIAVMYIINHVTSIKMAEFTNRLFQIYLARPVTFHHERNSAILLRNIIQSASNAFDGLRIALSIILDGFLTIAACILLLLVAPVVTLSFFASLAVIGVILYLLISPPMQAWGDSMHSVEARLIQWVKQSFDAIKEVKITRSADFHGKIFFKDALFRAQLLSRTLTAQHIPRVIVETAVIVIFLIMLWVLLSLNRPIADVISLAGLFGMAALRLMPSMNRVIRGFTDLRHRTAVIEDLYRDINEGMDDYNRENKTQKIAPIAFEKDIQIEGLNYRYPTSIETVLRDINLTISKGESIGLVGASGAGKSTLVDVIMGLVTPDKGHLLIDGSDAFNNIASWQCHIGYVPQHIFLNDDSIKRNVAFGTAESDIDDMRIAAALNMAQLDDVIADLPEGIETKLGEHGVRLSGGQRQRVGIARALYRNPHVLVLDEATSSLDTATEHEVSRAIEGLAGTKTLIIIAHRLSTVRSCDRIVFMRDGHIIDIGRYDELMERNSDFKNFAQTDHYNVDRNTSEDVTH
jgi:ABC-type bacteriocin/lantibiotic exporter with double-glycine peptidase domain